MTPIARITDIKTSVKSVQSVVRRIEQKPTEETKGVQFFVTFVCFCETTQSSLWSVASCSASISIGEIREALGQNTDSNRARQWIKKAEFKPQNTQNTRKDA